MNKNGFPKRELTQIVSLTVTGLGLRFFNLGVPSLWYDEILNVWDASHPFRTISDVIHASPPLFHYIVRCFYLMFGNNDFWLRVPAAFFGSITIPAFYFVARAFFSKRSAFWATLLLVFLPFHIVYSHELRMYTLVALLSLGSITLWEKAVETDRARTWGWYALLSLLGLYTHNWFAFLCFSQFLATCTVPKLKGPTRYGMASYGLMALGFLPWVPRLLKQTHQDQFSFLVASPWYHLRVTLEAFVGIRVPSGHSFVLAGVGASVILLGIFLFWLCLLFPKTKHPNPAWARILLAGFVLPLGIAFLTSIFFRPIYHGSRYTIIALPAFFLVLAPLFEGETIFARISRRLAVGCVALWMMSLVPFLTHFTKAPWKDLSVWLQKNMTPNDALVVSALPDTDRLAMWYYIPQNVPRYLNMKVPATAQFVFMPIRTYQLEEKLKIKERGWKVGHVENIGQVSVIEFTR